MIGANIRPIKRRLLPLRLGHGEIDSDHMAISNLWFQAVNSQPLQFSLLIGRMKREMERHFAREAEIMAPYQDEICACHQREHDALLRLCDRIKKMSLHDWRSAQSLLRHEFVQRVRDHVVCMDQLLVLLVNTNGSIVRSEPYCHERRTP